MAAVHNLDLLKKELSNKNSAKKIINTQKIDWEAAQIWQELAPHYFLADCFGGSSDLAGTGSTLFSGGLFLEGAQFECSICIRSI